MPIYKAEFEPTVECPSSTIWSSFLDGAIDETTLQALSVHLEVCTKCLRVVENISSRDEAHNGPFSPSPFLFENHCQRMLDKLNNLSSSELENVWTREQIHLPDSTMPDRIGRFQVRGVLGSGGFGRVYLADDVLLKRTVAIKAPKRLQLGSAQTIASFLHEARHAASLDHHAIVPIYDVIEDESGCTVIVMKHIDGKSLSSRLHSGTLPIDEAVRCMIRIANAVHYAHEKGLIHRDLKPSNILIDDNGLPFVTDFGLGINLRDAETTTNFSGGTPQYMSPEQTRNDHEQIDRRSDVWALGVILAELVHGQRPFSNSNREALYHSIANSEPDIDSTPSTLGIDSIIRTCLAKSPSQRFATAEELASELSRWLRHHFPTGISRWLVGWRRNLAIASAITISVASLFVFRMISQRSAMETSLRQLEASPADQIAQHISRLKIEGATPLFIENHDQPKNESGRLRFSIARIALGETRNDSIAKLADALPTAQSQEIEAVVEVLRATSAATVLGEELSQRMLENRGEFALPTVATFAGLLPNDSTWKSIDARVANLLIRIASRESQDWFPLFDSVGKSQLEESLRKTMVSAESQLDEQVNAAKALSFFFRNDIRYLVELVQDADPNELPQIVDVLRMNPDRSVAELKSNFDQKLLSESAAQLNEESPPTLNSLQLARLAVCLWLLDEPTAALSTFRKTEDPTLQTLVIHGLSQQNVAPKQILELLTQHQGKQDGESPSIRFALLQILSLLDKDRFEFELPTRLINELWSEDPDCGVHSMAKLVASRLGIPLQPLSRGQLEGWRTDLIGNYPQDFLVIEPCTANLGIQDPKYTKLLTCPWSWHRRSFVRTIAIATNELTIQQFRELDQEYLLDDYMLKDSHPESAMMMVRNLDVAYRFCNRLSEQHGLEPCYELAPDRENEEFVPKTNHLDLNGYRLPTDAEWELACRAGTSSPRYFGNVHELAPLYGWFWENIGKTVRSMSDGLQSQRVSQFLPNRWGLFDMYGNARELCDMSNEPSSLDEVSTDQIISHDDDFRRISPLLRGCSLNDKASVYAKSHSRTNRIVISSDRTVGFRLARTINPSDKTSPDGQGK